MWSSSKLITMTDVRESLFVVLPLAVCFVVLRPSLQMHLTVWVLAIVHVALLRPWRGLPVEQVDPEPRDTYLMRIRRQRRVVGLRMVGRSVTAGLTFVGAIAAVASGQVSAGLSLFALLTVMVARLWAIKPEMDRYIFG